SLRRLQTFDEQFKSFRCDRDRIQKGRINFVVGWILGAERIRICEAEEPCGSAKTIGKKYSHSPVEFRRESHVSCQFRAQLVTGDRQYGGIYRRRYRRTRRP